MIVKDEEEVITRAFDSIINIVDYYVICDTGSTDDTIKVIEEYFKKHNLRGEIHEQPWVNFAHNRTQAFDYGKGKCDYIMTLDADEVIAPCDKNGRPMLYHKLLTLPELKTDRVDIRTICGGVSYNRTQFYKDGLDWSWRWPIHEVCSAPQQKTSSVELNLCDVPSFDGKRRKDPLRYKRDALVFENWVLDNPEDARGWFYVAQSYRDAGQVKKAIVPLKKCEELSQWPEEKWLVNLRNSRYRVEGGEDFMSVIGYLWEAYNLRPWRAEPLHDMLTFFRQKNMWGAALVVGEIAKDIPYPSKDILFIEHEVYNWRIKDELSIVYYYVNRFDEAAQILKELIKDKDRWDYPPATLKRIRENLRLCNMRIKELKVATDSVL